MRIAIDAMGGDLAPHATVEGALLFDKAHRGKHKIILLGDREKLEAELEKHHFTSPRNISIVHTTQVVEMTDQPTVALQQKKDSSMMKGLQLQKQCKVDAFVSAGSTGAQMVGSLFILGRIKGVKRPALGSFLPTEGGVVLLIDVGANVDSKPEHLVQFALMGSIFMSTIYGINHPRVGLLSIGEEKTKGNDVVLSTYPLMTAKVPNFVGNVEGRDILCGKADIIVTDGFVGNTILKFAESIFGVFGSSFKKSIGKNLFSLLGAFMVRHAFREMKSSFDYQEYGGVPLLGVNGISIICHGRSTAKAIKNAIQVAVNMSEMEVNKSIYEELRKRGL
ncbi:phosphate--acyl-ACP acyltransferase [candidate division KSB1 bacterium 4484_188]|nr:MAG: phosphate--acyl-ACP acyltransferase [candidate division KSB1 bacterium 4484_188]HFE63850.1 phosphate acyltransferase PlsX [Caldithrix sp.]